MTDTCQSFSVPVGSCRFCTEFFARFRCGKDQPPFECDWPFECDCPKCQGYCECPVECEHSWNACDSPFFEECYECGAIRDYEPFYEPVVD